MADLLHFQSRASPRVPRRQSGRIGGPWKINMSASFDSRDSREAGDAFTACCRKAELLVNIAPVSYLSILSEMR